MKTEFVGDSSVVVAWTVPSQATPEADELLSRMESGHTLIVPPIWPLEVANALLQLARRKRLLPRDYRTALAFVRALNARVDGESTAHALADTVELAERYSLTPYAASYLELAARLALPLATRDVPLATAARKHGVATLIRS